MLNTTLPANAIGLPAARHFAGLRTHELAALYEAAGIARDAFIGASLQPRVTSAGTDVAFMLNEAMNEIQQLIAHEIETTSRPLCRFDDTAEDRMMVLVDWAYRTGSGVTGMLEAAQAVMTLEGADQ
ncbi:hypothetical protein [Terrihabitans rhizophilus]|uniref:Uncharacterized protein n=1 Tax=Terrihabitans rhizophilus TaxID=3092662 RepID=A0ABU4RQN6_9HYPH|nr:hypothetical protein [Terrihabitans sp. PJ23]MDX6807149.1 hypothetical protein [Terrihabitans sp. PJ23]